MSKQQRDYVFVQGSVKEPPFCEGSGDVLNVQVNLDEMIRLAEANPNKHRKSKKNGDRFFRLCISRKKEPTDYATHFMYEDPWEPDPNYGKKGNQQKQASKKSPSMKGKQYVEGDDEDELPF